MGISYLLNLLNLLNFLVLAVAPFKGNVAIVAGPGFHWRQLAAPQQCNDEAEPAGSGSRRKDSASYYELAIMIQWLNDAMN